MYIGKCILYIHWLFQSMLQSLLWYYHYPLCSQRFSEPTAVLSVFSDSYFDPWPHPILQRPVADPKPIMCSACQAICTSLMWHALHVIDFVCLLFSLTCNSQLGIHLVALYWRVLWGQSPWSFSKASLWKLIKDIIVGGQEKSLHQNSAGKKSDCYWNIWTWSNCVKISVYVCNNI